MSDIGEPVGATAATLDVWFEFASTYSYPALVRIGPLARAAGVRLRFRPFLLGPIFKAQGWDTSPFVIYPAKGRYMWRDLERICADLGLRWCGRRCFRPAACWRPGWRWSGSTSPRRRVPGRGRDGARRSASPSSAPAWARAGRSTIRP